MLLLAAGIDGLARDVLLAVRVWLARAASMVRQALSVELMISLRVYMPFGSLVVAEFVMFVCA